EALELLGSVRLAQGRGDSARECFRRLVYLVPGHEAGLLQLALLSEQDGDHEAAERYRERARRAAAREAVE
ncbi:MAG: methyltransferase, partial [Phycisphaerales bacterium]